MSIEKIKEYAKENNTSFTRSLIEISKKESEIVYYNYSHITNEKTYEYKINQADYIAEMLLNTIFENDNPDIDCQKYILNTINDNRTGDFEKSYYFTINDLYENNFFKDISNKEIFDTLNNKQTYTHQTLSGMSLNIFEKDPSVIQNKKELYNFLNNQINFIKNEEEDLIYKIDFLNNQVSFIKHQEKDIIYNIRNFHYLIDTVDKFCNFDPTDTIREFEELKRLIEADIPTRLFENNKRDTRCRLKMHITCFYEDLSYEDVRNKINYFRSYSDIDDFNSLSLKYELFKREPELFNDEHTVLCFVKDYIKYKDGNSKDISFLKDSSHNDHQKFIFKNLNILAADPDFNGFIEELQNNLTIDVMEVLKSDKDLCLMQEVIHFKNELANF